MDGTSAGNGPATSRSGDHYEIWCRITAAPDNRDCFWTLRPISDKATNWPNKMRVVRLATFQLSKHARCGDEVRVRREGTPGYGAWRAVGVRRTVRRWRKAN